MNFTVGVFRGLGTVIGASIVIAVMLWLLGLFTKIPLLGEYAKEFDQVVSGYLNDTNYNDEFDRMDETLKRIEDVLKETRDK